MFPEQLLPFSECVIKCSGQNNSWSDLGSCTSDLGDSDLLKIKPEKLNWINSSSIVYRSNRTKKCCYGDGVIPREQWIICSCGKLFCGRCYKKNYGLGRCCLCRLEKNCVYCCLIVCPNCEYYHCKFCSKTCYI